jgi:hypothetical protein
MDILAAIDAEIASLQQARALLAGASATKAKRGPGRPPKSLAAPNPAKKKRNISPEGRKRIAEAVRKRWAAQKKSAASK